MPRVWRRFTLQHFQDSVPGRVYAGLRRCMQVRSHPEKRMAAKRGTPSTFFFFGPRKRGVRPHPPNPLGYVPAIQHQRLICTCNSIEDAKRKCAWRCASQCLCHPGHQIWYCTAKNFRQRKISSKATVRQFVRNLFSSNGSLVLSSVVRFACLSVIFTLKTVSDPTLVVLRKI